MRRFLAWAVAVPLMVAGSEAAHSSAYRLVFPLARERAEVLQESGHDYFAYAPLALGVACALLLLALATRAIGGGKGQSGRAVPAWAFALLPPLGFALQEHLERLIHTGSFPLTAVLEPTFATGLALQLPFGLLAYAAARLLLRVADRIGDALHRPRRAQHRPRASARSWLPVQIEVPRVPVLAFGQPSRGPPATA